MPEIKTKGSIPVFSTRRSSCTTSNTPIETGTLLSSNIPTSNTGIGKPRQRSLPRSVALSTNTNEDNKALLNKYITNVNATPNNNKNHNNNININLTPSRTYNCNSLNRSKSTNDKNNNVIDRIRTQNLLLIDSDNQTMDDNGSINCVNAYAEGKFTAKNSPIKSKLVRPSTSVMKQKKDVDNNNNIKNANNNHSNTLYMNENLNMAKINFENNVENNSKYIDSKINVNTINNLHANLESNEVKISQQFQARPNFNFKENIYSPAHKNSINPITLNSNGNNNNNKNNSNSNIKSNTTNFINNNLNNNQLNNSKIPCDYIKKNTGNEPEGKKGSSNNSLNSEGSRLKPPRTVSSGRPSGLVKPKTHKSSRPTSPENTNRSLEDVLGGKPRSNGIGGKKQYRSSERILSSEKLNDSSMKESTNKPLRVNSIGRDVKSVIKYSEKTADTKKLMNDVENNFKNFSLTNEHHSRISGSSNDSSVTSSEEKASSEYSGNFGNRTRNKGISKSHSKLVVPGFAVKASSNDKSKLAKYPSKSNLPSFQQMKEQKLNLPKSSCQQRKNLSNNSINDSRVLNNPMKPKLKENFEAPTDAPNNSTLETIIATPDSSFSFQDTSMNRSPISFNANNTKNLTLNEIANNNQYKISKSEIGSSIATTTATKSTINENEAGGLVSAYDIQPMAPLSMSSPYFHLNSLTSTPHDKTNASTFTTFHSKNTTSTSKKPASTHEFQTWKLGMVHRLNMTSLDPANADENNSEAGYMSDGDLLSCKGHQRSSGYVSDGANSLLSFEKHKRNSNNPSVEDDSDIKRSFKSGRAYADTNSSIYEENFDALSSLSSNEDPQTNEHQPNHLSTSTSEHHFSTEDKIDNKGGLFERSQKIRSTMPAKGRKAILPLCGFVKKTHKNEEKTLLAEKDDTEIDVEVLFDKKVSTMKQNLPVFNTVSSASSIVKTSNEASMANEGMVDLDHIFSEYKSLKYENADNQSFQTHSVCPTHHVSTTPNFLDSKSQKSSHSLMSTHHSYSLFPNYKLPDISLSPNSTTLSLTREISVEESESNSVERSRGGSWNKEGITGSKFGMSLEQCYNSGVFQRRNSNNITSNNLIGNFLTLSDISQTQRLPNTINNSSLNDYESSQSNINNDIMKNHPNLNMDQIEKIHSHGIDGDPRYGKTPSKSNPYATMSRSQMALRMAKKLEMNRADAEKGYIRSCYATPITNRKSDLSIYHPDDASSIASFPFSKIKSCITPIGPFMQQQQSPFNLDDSCYSGVAGSSYGGSVVSASSGGNYMLHRSGSYKVRNSRPPSTNENGSTLSLGSCSSLYSTAEEHHAQEIRKLRHELETAHSRVASLNMQLNINENVVQAFEQSISHLNQRLSVLTQGTSQNVKETDFTDIKSCFEQIDPSKNNMQENSSCISNLNHQQDMERKKKQKKWLSSFGKSFFKKKSKMSSYENELVEMNQHAEENNKINSNHINNNNFANPNQNKNANNSHYNIVISNYSAENAENANSGKKHSTQKIPEESDTTNSDPIEALEQRLHEKELKLTDVQLEALSSAHQLGQLKDNMAQMEKEMMYLKMDNSRLKQQLVGISRSSLNEDDEDDENKVSSSSPLPLDSHNDERECPELENANTSHKKIILSVQFKHTSHYNSLAFSEVKSKEILFGKMHLTENIGWETLNRTVAGKFESYLARVDPEERLGLSHKSIKNLRVGELSWSLDGPAPCMSPSSYFIGFQNSVSLTLKGVNEDSLDALAFETMISKKILERYVGLLLDFRRVIFCGPSGTGKTYLALKLAQYMYDRLARERKDPSLSVFNVDHKSSKELRQYLSNITRNCINNTNNPNVNENNSNYNNSKNKSDQINVDQNELVKNDDNENKEVNSVEELESNTNKNDNSSHCNSSVKNKVPPKNNVVITNISTRDHLPHNNIIVLDNLHHVVSLADVFNGFVSIGNHNSPYVIGTMNQVSSGNTTNLQLHHMFRWVLYSNHIRPVSGFLGKFLRRHMIEREVLESERGDFNKEKNIVQSGVGNEENEEEELKATIEWMPMVWQYVNKLLEAHNSSEVTLGPQLYLSCPMGGRLMRVWFTDLWNYSIFPYIVEALKEGIQTYGCKAVWEDPTMWLEEKCPWRPQEDSSLELLHLRPEDVGYDLQLQPQQQQLLQPCQQQQQHYQPSSPHINGHFKLQNKSKKPDHNSIAFQTLCTNNNIENNLSNNDFNKKSTINNYISDNTNNYDDNMENGYGLQTEQDPKESLMSMLLKMKEARSQQ